MKIRGWSAVAVALGVLSALAMLATALFNDGEGYRLALVPFLLSVTFLLAARTGVTADVLERVETDGYDLGFAAGCKAMASAGLADRAAPLTLLRTPQQLTQQHDVASGADRVR